MKKNKLLICALFMSLILTALPGMESYAAVETGENAASSGLQDENSQRLETVTAMDEDGSIYEVGETDGTVDENDEEVLPDSGIALFSARSAGSVSLKVVNFNTKSNDTTDFTYSGGSGYTNGDYGADAAYLGTDGNGKVRFMLAGVTGTVKESEVQVLDYSDVADNVSYYEVSGGKLIHYISYNLNKSPGSSINNGPAPAYLSEGTKYYSYDGHYFYTDYETMLNDYQNGSNGAAAVNSGNPFYNYFQFLDMNSSTNYTGKELDSILQAKITSSSSKLLGTGSLFVKYQDMYSVNALLSLGIAVNESAWGTSSICVNKNNLFGLNAVDKSPGESANYFASVEDCIREFMSEWMADGYLSSSDWRNHGELLGNKAEGINVSYASDPYWGEKAAAIAWELDAAGGSHDYLGISSDDTDESPVTDTDTPSSDNIPPSGTEDSSDKDESAGMEDTAGEDESAGTEDTTGKDESAGTEDSSDKDESAGTEDTAGEDESAGTEDTAGKDESAGTEDTAGKDESAGTEDTTGKDESAGTEDTTGKDESAGTEDTTGKDESAGAEDAEDMTDITKPVTDSGQDTTTTDDKAQADDANQTDDKTSDDKISERELANLDQGIRVSGKLSGDAVLNVRAIDPNTDIYDSYVSADPVKGKVIRGVYDITLTGTLDGEAKLVFQVGSEYNGKNVVILHYLDDGSYETHRTTVENGQAVISVSSFSPYVIALDGESTGNRAPQTGDTGSPGVWLAMMGLSAVLGMAVLFRRKSLR